MTNNSKENNFSVDAQDVIEAFKNISADQIQQIALLKAYIKTLEKSINELSEAKPETNTK